MSMVVHAIGYTIVVILFFILVGMALEPYLTGNQKF